MRVFDLFCDLNIIQLDVQELVDRFEGSAYRNVVLKLDRDLVVDKGFEEANSMD